MNVVVLTNSDIYYLLLRCFTYPRNLLVFSLPVLSFHISLLSPIVLLLLRYVATVLDH